MVYGATKVHADGSCKGLRYKIGFIGLALNVVWHVMGAIDVVCSILTM